MGFWTAWDKLLAFGNNFEGTHFFLAHIDMASSVTEASWVIDREEEAMGHATHFRGALAARAFHGYNSSN